MKLCKLYISLNKYVVVVVVVAFQRTVVLLEKKRTAVPVNAEMSRLINARRVMDIAFTKNHTASQIGDLLCGAFPSLVGKDLGG